MKILIFSCLFINVFYAGYACGECLPFFKGGFKNISANILISLVYLLFGFAVATYQLGEYLLYYCRFIIFVSKRIYLKYRRK